MKVLKTLLIGLLALIVLLIVIALFLPSAAHVERSTSISAPPATVFDIVNSLKRFNEWSPWYELDPAARFAYSGPENGVGARVEWSSDTPELGSGSQEIVESVPLQRVRTQLDFADDGQAQAGLALAPEGEGTKVTWALDMQFGYNLPARYFGLWLDRVLGPYYEEGLKNLKVIAEAEATDPGQAVALEVRELDVPALDIVYVAGTSPLDPAAIDKALRGAYAEINAFLTSNGLQASGAPLAINEFYDESGWGYEAAVPFTGPETARTKAADKSGTIKVGKTYAGRALHGVHIGPRDGLPDVYRQLEDHMAQHHLEPNGRSWEQYVGEAASSAPGEQETHVFIPVKPGA